MVISPKHQGGDILSDFKKNCIDVQIFIFKMALTTEQNAFAAEAYFRLNYIMPDFFDNLRFSDKALFLLSGRVNSKNDVF